MDILQIPFWNKPLASTISVTVLWSSSNSLPADTHHVQSSHAFRTVLKTCNYKQYHNSCVKLSGETLWLVIISSEYWIFNMRLAITPWRTVHWLFRSHDLPSKFSPIASCLCDRCNRAVKHMHVSPLLRNFVVVSAVLLVPNFILQRQHMDHTD